MPRRAPLPAEIIRRKRDGGALSDTEIQAFASGLAAAEGQPERWADAQVGALAMAILLRGMDRAETVALTRAMTRSGRVLDWGAPGSRPPVVDKHSTGGIGDKTSLVLAPVLAACGAWVPMISGRGLGHTGGTLDKLEAIPGFSTAVDEDALRRQIGDVGCAIVSAGATMAPADRRLYAIRDVTATVESLPLITASILSKKLAAGLDHLVMDVKFGNGAFMQAPEDAEALARSLVEVSAGAGLPTVAWLTDMNEVLGSTAGNALEVLECLRMLRGEAVDARLDRVTRTLCAEGLLISGLAADATAAHTQVDQALRSGRALERFAAMLRAQGGPTDFVEHAQHLLPSAPVQLDVKAPHAGVLEGMDTRALGVVIVSLGGGRRRPADLVDPRVGLSDLVPLGTAVRKGDRLARVHAADAEHAAAAEAQVLQALRWSQSGPATRPDVLSRRLS